MVILTRNASRSHINTSYAPYRAGAVAERAGGPEEDRSAREYRGARLSAYLEHSCQDPSGIRYAFVLGGVHARQVPGRRRPGVSCPKDYPMCKTHSPVTWFTSGTLTRLVLVALVLLLSWSITKAQTAVYAWGPMISPHDDVSHTDVPAGLTNIVAIASGPEHNMALRSDGTIVHWGSSADGEANTLPGATNVVAIAAADWCSAALLSDQTVRVWGDNVALPGQPGQTNVPPGLTNVVAIAAGFQHMLALRNDGTLVAWGNDTTPKAPEGLSNVVAVAGGWSIDLALKSDGTVVAFTGAEHGWKNLRLPAAMTNRIVAVAAGGGLTVLKSDGTVLHAREPDWQAVLLDAAEDAIAIAQGWSDECLILKRNGTIQHVSPIVFTPPLLAAYDPPPGLRDVVAIAKRSGFGLALTGDVPLPHPRLNLVKIGAKTELRVATLLGKTYYAEYRSSLTDGHWTILAPVPGDGTEKVVAEINPADTDRFYQVRVQ